MKKWITNEKIELLNKKLFKINNYRCYHPVKEVSHDFHIIETYDWINIIALTEDNKFIMVKQHRLGTDELTLETVAGLIEKNEDPLEAAKRELLEETGYKEKEMIFLKKTSVNPAIMNNYIYFYLARGCEKHCEQCLDKAEDIEVLFLSKDEILKMIDNGEIDHTIAIAGLSLYFLFWDK